MNKADFPILAWSLNQVYNAIYNCKAWAPAYEQDGFYNDEFMLYKRDGLTYKYNLGTNVTTYDRVTLSTKNWYLNSSGFTYQIRYENSVKYSYSFNSSLPKKLLTGVGVTWPRIDTATVTTQNSFVGWSDFVDIPGYSGGYVTVTCDSITGVSVGNYAFFTSGILKGAVNKIYKIDGNTIYIIGTNARGSLPQPWDTISFYASTGQVLISCDEVGVKAHVIDNNTNSIVETVSLINLPGIIDIAKYDWNLFVLTKQFMYFTRSTFDDNLQFYPLDFYKIDEGKKLFPCGKAMIVFANTNKLFAAANGTSGAIGYVGYDINYNAELFSQHSCIFVDQAIYVMQKDRRLMQIDIVQSNSTSYDLVAKDMNQGTRWIFERVQSGEVEFKSYDKFMYLIHRQASTTTIYEYDKQLQHWIMHTYPVVIYWYDFEAYGSTGVYNRTGDTDLWNPIEQRINFALVGGMEILMPMVIRTLYARVWTFDINLNVGYDLWGMYEEQDFKITSIGSDYNYYPDVDAAPWVDVVPPTPESNQHETLYSWKTISHQINLYKSGRFINFTYYSTDAFALGKTMVIYDKMGTFINEVNY